ncbi:myo-inosose-2 dehydratase [Lichenicoccus sp.]|uniref:myo-inosose-2 dehydratase n=1 Tax=Lichenicoccus sp. TaxID=2781899 RepID=UPI003D0984F4
MAFNIGVSPVAWSNDDLPALGGDTPLEVCLDQARQAGFTGIELGCKFPRSPDALLAALSPFGLACISGWHAASLLARDAEAELRHLRPHLDLLRAVASRVMVLAETSNAVYTDRAAPLSHRPILAEADWPQFGERLTEVGDALRTEGVQLVYHHHMGTVVQSAADIAALMTHTGPSVQLLLDTGHASWAGADPAVLAERYRNRIGHVHAKDVRADVRAQAESADWSFLDSVLAGVFTVPGDGSIDFAPVLRQLRGYSGWLVIEADQDPAVADPLLYATMGRRNLIRMLADSGF